MRGGKKGKMEGRVKRRNRRALIREVEGNKERESRLVVNGKGGKDEGYIGRREGNEGRRRDRKHMEIRA